MQGLQDQLSSKANAEALTDHENNRTHKQVVEISGQVFELRKRPDNNLKHVLEKNDVIIGFTPNGDYMYAIYLGGIMEDFNNPGVYNNFNGFNKEN